MSDRPKALLADLDGTIIDSKSFTVDSFVLTIKQECGIDIPWEKAAALFGVEARETFRRLAPPGADLDVLCRAQTVFQLANLDRILVYPGVIDTLSRLRDAQIGRVVVTSRTANTNQVLRATSLLGLFDHIISGDDVLRHKPDPECVNVALDKLRVPARLAYMMGDSRVDIQAGKRAGVPTVGVTWGHLGRKLNWSRPTHKIDQIQGLLPLFSL